MERLARSSAPPATEIRVNARFELFPATVTVAKLIAKKSAEIIAIFALCIAFQNNLPFKLLKKAECRLDDCYSSWVQPDLSY